MKLFNQRKHTENKKVNNSKQKDFAEEDNMFPVYDEDEGIIRFYFRDDD